MTEKSIRLTPEIKRDLAALLAVLKETVALNVDDPADRAKYPALHARSQAMVSAIDAKIQAAFDADIPRNGGSGG